MSNEFTIKSLCLYFEVSRSGYYKWLKRKGSLNSYQINRRDLKDIVIKYYEKKPTWGYRNVNSHIRKDYGWIVSDNLVWNVRNELGLRSSARKPRYDKNTSSGLEHIKYPNILNGNFKASRPFEKICTDTTMISHKGKVYDLNLYIDLFNKEIVSYDLSPSNYGHGIKNHFNALKKFLIEKEKRGYIKLETILHSDQGSIYTSRAFNAQLDNTTVIRSMSRAGMPTDNPVIESFNGWMKDELEYNFKYKEQDNIYEVIDEYIDYHNNYRLAYSLQYKSPAQYKYEQGYIYFFLSVYKLLTSTGTYK